VRLGLVELPRLEVHSAECGAQLAVGSVAAGAAVAVAAVGR
jgi:hypothetical protein